MSKNNFYENLGLKQGAKHEEVKKAFHELSRIWHTDKNPIDATEDEKIYRKEKYDLIKESYEKITEELNSKKSDNIETNSSSPVATSRPPLSPNVSGLMYNISDLSSFESAWKKYKKSGND